MECEVEKAHIDYIIALQKEYDGSQDGAWGTPGAMIILEELQSGRKDGRRNKGRNY